MMELLGELLFGWLLADLVTGIFHWLEDRFGTEETPLVGQWIIAPNRLHHREPLKFLEHGFWGRNLAAIVTALIAAAILTALFGPSLWIATLALGGGLTNEVHRYAHAPSQAPTWVRLFQQTGLFQSSHGHKAHHRPPQDSNYCVLTDWLNPFLEAGRVWERLEGLIHSTTVSSPQR